MPEPLSKAISNAPLASLVAAVFDSVVEGMQRRLPAAGFPDIRPAHCLGVFRVIDGDGTRPTELARRAGVTPQAMAEFVRYLESRGYVERAPDPSDGRGMIVKMTGRGKKAHAAALKAFAGIEATWARQLGAQNMVHLRQMLSEVAGMEP